MNLFEYESIAVRILQDNEEDKNNILSWLSNPTVTELVYGELVPINMNKIEEHFTAKLYDNQNVTPCIIEYTKKSIGYLQFYHVDNSSFKFKEKFENCDFTGGYGIDIFIGLPEMWGKEIGTKTIMALKEYLFDKLRVSIVCADPQENNRRSIRCWEKAGFVKIGSIPNYDEPKLTSILMAARKDSEGLTEKNIEDYIGEVLIGDTKTNALGFVKFLRTKGMEFVRGDGYWANQLYWYVKYKDEYVCFILVNGTGEEKEMAPLAIWSDDSSSAWYENFKLDDQTKKIAWNNVDICGKCSPNSPCYGGIQKIIFGKEFDHVCRTTFRFDKPDAKTFGCVKTLIEIRKNNILNGLQYIDYSESGK